jgi:poly-beta-1,6-N-acetyl-D-glucosamine synthase
MTRPIKYVVISPVRNEAEYLPSTISSMLAQTVRPCWWVIVDDGSTDQTGPIARRAASAHPWIKVVHRQDRGFRKAGGGVVDAFYDGYRLVEGEAWDYLIKLDGDLSFGVDYFQRCFDCFEYDRKLGIAGGTICTQVNGVAQPEVMRDPKFHVRGATKIYRSTCWQQMGGLIAAPGWDTLDEVKANMLGWTTSTLPGINVIHHRPTGLAYGLWKDNVKAGLANYITGYHPLFMVFKFIRRVWEKPRIVGACGVMSGFIKGYIKRIPKVPDRALIRYLREQQINRLLGRKSLWSEAEHHLRDPQASDSEVTGPAGSASVQQM